MSTSFDSFLVRLEEKRAKWHPIHRWLTEHPPKGIAGRNSWFWLTNPHKVLTELPRYYYKRVLWFCQRGLRGYSEFDVWNLGHYLCRWMPDALAELQKGHGYPPSLTQDIWVATLEEMRQGFIAREQMSRCDTLQDGEYEMLEKVFEKGMAQLTKWYGHLWG